MNKTYKVLFNRVRGVATAVSEIASSHQARKKAAVASTVAMAMGLMAGQAMAASPLFGATDSPNTKYRYVDNKGNLTQADGDAACPTDAWVTTPNNKYLTTTKSNVTASNNEFEIKEGSWQYVVGGTSDNNSVTVSGNAEISGWGNVPGDVFGAHSVSENGSTNENIVTVRGGTVAGSIYGGFSENNSATDNATQSANSNTVQIEGGTFSGSNKEICGGKVLLSSDQSITSVSATASNNKVKISGGTFNNQMVHGGYTELGETVSGTETASGNVVEITAGSFLKVNGGYSEYGSTNNNSVTIGEGAGTITKVYGGNAGADATGNSVKVSGGTISYSLYGAYSYSGNAGGTSFFDANKVATEQEDGAGNFVSVSGGTVSGNIYGGCAETAGSANYNSVNISENAVIAASSAYNSYIFGGYTNSTKEGAEASNNKVSIDGGTFTPYIDQNNSKNNKYIYVYGAESFTKGNKSGATNNNAVSISDVEGITTAMAGYSQSYTEDSGTSATSESASNNTISVSNANVGYVYGGCSYAYSNDAAAQSGAVQNNTVTIDGGTIETVYAGYSGAYSTSGSATTGVIQNNNVTIEDGTIGDVYAGYSYGFSGTGTSTSGDVQNNTVTVCAGTISGSVTAGYSYRGSAGTTEGTGNNTSISGGTVSGSIYGGYVASIYYGGSANYNSVSISNNAVIAPSSEYNSYIIGGYTASTTEGAEASHNKVTIDGGTFTPYIDQNDSDNNKYVYVYGGYSNYGATTNGNTVEIKSMASGSVRNVTGGYSYGATESGDANNNTVTVSAGTIGGYVTGGWVASDATSGSANNNTVTVSGGTIGSDVTGGCSYGASESGGANNNTVTVSAGTIAGCVSGGASLNGSAGTTEGTGNTVSLSGTAILKNTSVSVASGKTEYFGAIGGWSGGETATTANYNTVTVRDTASLQYEGTVAEGGTVYVGVFGGLNESTSEHSSASHNSVNIEGGTMALDLVGESLATYDTMHQGIYGGYVISGCANNNTVIINGGKSEDVTGGYALNNGASANYNAVIWKSGTISEGVYGGTGSYNVPAAVSLGNTLVVSGSAKSTLWIGGFQNYLFLLDETTNNIKNTNTAALTSSFAATDNLVMGLSSTDKIGVAITKDSGLNLHQNDRIVLMTVNMGLTDASESRSNQVSAIQADLAGNASATTWINSNIELESKVNKYEFALSNEDLWKMEDYDFIEGTDGKKDSLVATVTRVEPTIVVSDVRQMASGTAINFRSQINDVASRMGDLRLTNSDGLWARVYGGKYTLGSGMKEKAVTLQVGGDKWFNQNSYVGLTGSYTKADDTLTRGDNDQKIWNFGVYGGFLAENGMYVDAIAKYGRFGNDFTLAYESGEIVKGKYHTWGTSLSVEGGWRLDCPKTSFYVEPQVELIYGHLQSVNFSADGIDFRHDGVDTLVGRVGAAVGYKFAEQKGGIHFKASLLHDFKGEVKTEARAGSETDGGSTRDLGGTWGEFTLGMTYRVTDKFNVYNQMKVSTKAAGVKTKWQGSLGMRYMF